MTTTREEFEAWFSDGLPAKLQRNGDGYVFMAAQSAWVAWQAAHLAGQRAMQTRAGEVANKTWEWTISKDSYNNLFEQGATFYLVLNTGAIDT